MAPALSFLHRMMLCVFFLATAMASYNISDYGAKPDGRTDSAKPFLNAWAAACNSTEPAAIYVPAGHFLISQATFKGPCKNNATMIFVDGTLIAPSAYGAATNWLLFEYVQGLSIFGGTIDGQGQAFWAFRKAGRRCPQGAMQQHPETGRDHHRPGHSPNTDGIHIQKSSNVAVIDTGIETGDDCIPMGEGSTNDWIEKIDCGPGHGISIGSLGGTTSEAGAQNITVTSVAFSGTENELRIN
ncbi:polygalacturonase-like [Musa acuminata AAA Group]|uniref:polygalacturonase-like n=1 Tax=Musa acuminata AAA Group TaxID=214697 RepID=UPI0031E47503